MKYAVILGDGMADRPFKDLNDKTPLEIASHPCFDKLAQKGLFGLAKTVPDKMPAGSDTANLSVFGYDPEIYYSGRSPLEAASLGIRLEPNDVTYRCNLVTLSQADCLENAVMVDYSGGEIDSESGKKLIEAARERFGTDAIQLFAGVSYRNCLVLRNAEDGCELTPPHDISGRPIKEYLPKGTNSGLMLDIMKWAYNRLKDHPVNTERAQKGENTVNCLWFWGEGRKPKLTPYAVKFGINQGAVISAVDLIQGIGKCAGLQIVQVSGATGTYTTDFAAKGKAAIDMFKSGAEFVYIHVEAPDECGHHRQVKEKIYSIEQIDEKIATPLLEYLENCGDDYAVLLCPDHPTPLEIMTHTADPVPFALYFSDRSMPASKVYRYTEAEAAKTGVYIDKAHTLMEIMTGKANI